MAPAGTACVSATATSGSAPADQTPPCGRLAECRLSFCTLWVESDQGLCKAHATRWRNAGSPPLEDFIVDCEHHGAAVIDFRNLPPQLRLELQYAVQCRRDEQAATLPLYVANWARCL